MIKPDAMVGVISHASSLKANQAFWLALEPLGYKVRLITPSKWIHDYSTIAYPSETGLIPQQITRPIMGKGKVPLHVYLGRLRKWLRGVDLVHIDQEPYSLAASQWGFAARALDLPYTFSTLQNINKQYPAPIRTLENRFTRSAALAFTLNDEVEGTLRARGYRGRSEWVPLWVDIDRFQRKAAPRAGKQFNILYAGRFVTEKGVDELIHVKAILGARISITAVGAGPRDRDMRTGGINVLAPVSHLKMQDVYAKHDVLVVPSRTTSTWKEQFGRVVVEALACGVPVIVSDSGSLPALARLTGGGLVFNEMDVVSLADRLEALQQNEGLYESLSRNGYENARRIFSINAVAQRMADTWDSLGTH